MNKEKVKEYLINLNAHDYSIFKFVYAPKIQYSNIYEFIVYYNNMSIEERRDKFIELMKDKNRVWNFKTLDKYGILKQLIPEIEYLKGISVGDKYHHPEKDIFIHTIAALSHLNRNDSIELIFGVILHDIGKPTTFFNYHFYSHAQIGAEMSEMILTRLKFNPEIIQKVKWLISQHMRIKKFNEIQKYEKIKLMEHPLFSELLKLLNADIMINDKKILDDIQQFKNKQYYKEE